MTKRPTLLCLLILLLAPMTTWAMEPAELDAGGLDLRLLQEDIPTGSWAPASPRSGDRLPSLGNQPMRGEGRNEGARPTGGFRTDLPYGAGYEARQGQGSGSTGMGRGGSGMGQGSGRGMGGGRSR